MRRLRPGGRWPSTSGESSSNSPPSLAQPPSERIPEAVISRLAEKNQNKMTWLLADLRHVQHSLNEETPLGEHDFAALDEVCDAADATASASFRRLWRR